MSENLKSSRKSETFEYYLEDLDCRCCLFSEPTDSSQKCGCEIETCCFDDIRQSAVANGRITRPKGWNKYSV